MNTARRAWLGWLAGQAAGAGTAASHAAPASPPAPALVPPAPPAAIRRGRALAFPRDHGAHLDARIEWWYVTGWLGPDAATEPTPTHGFQVTFFRSTVAGTGAAATSAPIGHLGHVGRTGRAGHIGRFAPLQLLFAHAAVTDLASGRHLHAQRIARWNGEADTGPDRASSADAEVRLGRWHLARDAASPWQASRWRTALRTEAFSLQGTLQSARVPLLQGDAGFSRKGPDERQASHYYSLPHLDARLTLELHGRHLPLRGRAWLDHEWSDELLHPQAVGWDWIGINLFDGRALTAFRLRRADGSTLWAGGSQRGAGPGAAPRAFEPGDVSFEPGQRWRSAATNAQYPVAWQVRTPAGRHTVRALLDAQELDSRGSTGAVYWEGLAELLDEGGQRVGLGYLEMTGYAAPIRLG